MKKALALILAGMTALSLCACDILKPSGNGKAPEETVNYFEGAQFYQPDFYVRTGTGPAKEGTPDSEKYYVVYYFSDDGTILDVIKDETVKSKIAAWKDEAVKRAEDVREKLIEQGKTDKSVTGEVEVNTDYNCINGYFFVDVYVRCNLNDDALGELYYVPYYCEKAVFDIFSGEKLDISDLFYQDVDYVSYFNDFVYNEANQPYMFDDFSVVNIPMKREFGGLTNDCVNISFNTITFPKDNPFFSIPIEMYYSSYSRFFYDNSVIWDERDMDGVFIDGVEVSYYDIPNTEENDITYKQGEKVNTVIMSNIIESSTVLDDAKIKQLNSLAYEAAKSERTDSFFREKTGKGLDAPAFDENGYFDGFLLYMDVLTEEGIVLITVKDEYLSEESICLSYIYDIDTLEELSNDDVLRRFFGNDWRETCKVSSYYDEYTEEYFYDNYENFEINYVSSYISEPYEGETERKLNKTLSISEPVRIKWESTDDDEWEYYYVPYYYIEYEEIL